MSTQKGSTPELGGERGAVNQESNFTADSEQVFPVTQTKNEIDLQSWIELGKHVKQRVGRSQKSTWKRGRI
jgi:hypothetical protein